MANSSVFGAPDLDITEAPTEPKRSAASSAADPFVQPRAPMLTAVAVAVLVVLAITTARAVDLQAALWAANGLAVGVWLRSSRRHGFDLSFGAVMAFGIFVGELLAGRAPIPAVGSTVANMVEIVAAVLLARRFAPTLNLSTVQGASRIIFGVAVVAPIAAGLVSATMLVLIEEASFLMSFQTWWVGHALGLAVVTPFILAFDKRPRAADLNPLRIAETVVLFTLLAVVCVAVYFMTDLPLKFTIVPVFILIAVRLRLPGVTAALLMVSVAAMVSSQIGADATPIAITDPAGLEMVVQLRILLGYLPIVLIASLLDERDRLSEQAKAGQLRAERASTAKSRLLANVAHEIKSPIGGIIGIGDLWSTGQLGPVTATQNEMAAMLVKTARQVEALSHDLLDVARAESGAVKVELRPTDVCGILEDIRSVTVLRPEAQALTVSVLCEGDGLVAIADSQRLAQVVDNLATNAVKYAAGGGSVLLRACRIHEGVRIEVVDRGPGLTPEKQAQLFEPFNRLGLERSTVEGHGIGLALAKRLVELQGGTIGVDSVLGQGSTFWIELPAA